MLTKVGLGIAALLLLSAFKNKLKPKTLDTRAGDTPLIEQLNAPTGTPQAYSLEGTRIFDQNQNLIFTYTEAGLPMSITGQNDKNQYSVVIGLDFMNGTSGFVNMEDVNAY